MDNIQEYELYLRRRAFEALLAGEASAAQMALLDLEPGRQQYALALFSVPRGQGPLRDALLGHFLKYPAYTLLEWSVWEYLVIIKAAPEELNGWTARCAETFHAARADFPGVQWHAALTPAADSPAALAGCYEMLSRLWAHRYLLPAQTLLTQQTVGRVGDEEVRLLAADIDRLDPARLRELLEKADGGQVSALVDRLLQEQGQAVGSDSFCRFLALGTRFAAARFVEERGWNRRDFVRTWELELPADGRIGPELLRDYLTRAIRGAVSCRDGGVTERCPDALRQAAVYIGANFTREGLSLEQVAAAVELSPNYLSALFRRELDCTFVEYVTKKRMAKARELLEQGSLRSGQIAKAVGYRDPRYFSSLFKKTQGMTPMEYRKSKKSTD